jgi:DNA-directed RNA polymerase subunit RPC12/RpoP
MPIHPVYEFTCICGRNFQTDDPTEIQCPDCGRALVIEWRGAQFHCAVIPEIQEVLQ